MRVLVAAGGTGGHVFPALAVAQRLREQGVEVHWLGTDRGLEARVTQSAGIALTVLHGFQGVRGKGPLAWLSLPWRLTRALSQTWALIRRLRPAAVLTFGGYVTVPAGLVARLMSLPLLVHEQNAVMGSANRLLSGWARVVALSFSPTAGAPSTAVLTGNPVRAAIAALGGVRGSSAGRTGPLRILVVGGSLGAQALNRALPGVLQRAAGSISEGIAVWHQTGADHAAETQAAYDAVTSSAGLASVRVDAFVEDMAAAYAWADLAICRAGASTVSELIEIGLPAVLVPLPSAIDDHQTANAQAMVGLGLAKVVSQRSDDFPEELLSALKGLNRGRLSEMAQSAQPQFACDRFVSLVAPFLTEKSS